MIKRWIIRTFSALPILLCILGWGWSGTHQGEIDFARNGCFVQFGAESGVAWLGSGGTSGGIGIPDGWIFSALPNGPRRTEDQARFWPLGTAQIPSLLGFGFVRSSPTFFSIADVAYAGVPFWFLILVFSALAYLTWRKNRPKINPKTAFPIEVGKHKP